MRGKAAKTLKRIAGKMTNEMNIVYERKGLKNPDNISEIIHTPIVMRECTRTYYKTFKKFFKGMNHLEKANEHKRLQ